MGENCKNIEGRWSGNNTGDMSGRMMGGEKMSVRLERAYKRAGRIMIDSRSRIVCMSDCHRGVGNSSDNFLPNENLFLAALQYYYDRCFCYIEVGDGDELWENRKFDRIAEIHSDVFEMLGKFHESGRLLMLYGNHDCEKVYGLRQFPRVYESIILENHATGHEVFVVHGHQGDWLNDILWRLARVLVRYVWKPLETVGVSDPTSAARNYKKCKKAEKRMNDFSVKRNLLLLAGHTHRPVLPKPGEGFYMNDGSCVHPRTITAMEIENGAITLVKWVVTVRKNQTLAVAREILAGPYMLEDYWKVK